MATTYDDISYSQAGAALGSQWAQNRLHGDQMRFLNASRKKEAQDHLKAAFGVATVLDRDGNVDVLASAAKQSQIAKAAMGEQAQGAIDAFRGGFGQPQADSVGYRTAVGADPMAATAMPILTGRSPDYLKGMAGALPSAERIQSAEEQRLMMERRYDQDRIIREASAKATEELRKQQAANQKAAGLRAQQAGIQKVESDRLKFDLAKTEGERKERLGQLNIQLAQLKADLAREEGVRKDTAAVSKDNLTKAQIGKIEADIDRLGKGQESLANYRIGQTTNKVAEIGIKRDAEERLSGGAQDKLDQIEARTLGALELQQARGVWAMEVQNARNQGQIERDETRALLKLLPGAGEASGAGNDITERQGVPGVVRRGEWYPLSSSAANLYLQHKELKQTGTNAVPMVRSVSAVNAAIRIQRGIVENVNSTPEEVAKARARLEILQAQQDRLMGSGVAPQVTTNMVPSRIPFRGPSPVVTTNYGPATAAPVPSTNAVPDAVTPDPAAAAERDRILDDYAKNTTPENKAKAKAALQKLGYK